MSVEFDEDVATSSYGQPGQQYGQMQQFAPVSNDQPKLVALVIRMGLAKDENGANKVLIGITLCAFLLTIFVVFKFIL